MRHPQIVFLLLLGLCRLVSAQVGILEHMLGLAGGKERLEALWKDVSDHASIMRDGMKNVMDGDHQGLTALIKRITFEDGVEWAAKLSQNGPLEYVQQGLNSIQAIERYCSDIPIPRTHGTLQTVANSSFIYHFMDWIDGVPLNKDSEYVVIEYDHLGISHLNITLPNQIIPQLAEFVYNLTTCRIPQTQSMFSRLV